MKARMIHSSDKIMWEWGIIRAGDPRKWGSVWKGHYMGAGWGIEMEGKSSSQESMG